MCDARTALDMAGVNTRRAEWHVALEIVETGSDGPIVESSSSTWLARALVFLVIGGGLTSASAQEIPTEAAPREVAEAPPSEPQEAPLPEAPIEDEESVEHLPPPPVAYTPSSEDGATGLTSPRDIVPREPSALELEAQEALSPRNQRRAFHVRLQNRMNQERRLRLSVVFEASPRAADGYGPFDRTDGRWLYYGAGIRGSIQRYLTPYIRFDLDLSLSFIAGEDRVGGQHGIMSTLGGRALFVMPSRVHFALGVGADFVAAREREAGPRAAFGWAGVRLVYVLELGWLEENGRGVTLQLGPTLTHAPYSSGLTPGAVAALGYEFGI